VCAHSEQYVPSALNIAANLVDKKTGRKVKTIAHVYEDSAYGQAENVLTRKEASRYGLELIHSQAFPGGSADLTPYVNKLKSVNPDFVTGSVFFFDVCNFIRTFKEQKFNPMGYHFGAEQDEFISAMKKDADYTFTWLPWDEKIKGPRVLQTFEKFRKKFQSNMDPFSALGYTSVYVLKEAFERAGSTDSDKLLSALKQTDLPQEKGNILAAKGGRIQFDERGENKNVIVMEGQILNQKREIIFPPEYKTGEAVFPIPKWEERA
jgi:branched-chain amino acid transport system substrate-binding protein